MAIANSACHYAETATTACNTRSRITVCRVRLALLSLPYSRNHRALPPLLTRLPRACCFARYYCNYPRIMNNTTTRGCKNRPHRSGLAFRIRIRLRRSYRLLSTITRAIIIPRAIAQQRNLCACAFHVAPIFQRGSFDSRAHQHPPASQSRFRWCQRSRNQKDYDR